ncbi:MAG: ATP-binding protein [Saprospiraceae bacterium]|nr:ATP-binding protein [Saprospiraceae bacterium]
MLKNPTPNQIAIFTSLLVTILSTLFLLVFSYFSRFPIHYLLYICWAVVIFSVTYLVTIYYLQRYIYRKIKVIYKTIRDERLQTHEKSTSIDINRNIIDDVEREVTEWAENQRREIDKYKSWAEYRRQFMGDISHELKTPIFNIQGYLHTLLDGGLQDEEINVSFLQKAAKNVERLNTIVEDLESIARLESEELILEMQTFDIKKLTEEVFEDMEMKANARNIKLEFKEGAAQNYKVRADRESIRQVLMNLVSNSIKYGNPEGRSKVSFYDMDRYILVEVADNGIGISKEHLKHIFDRFYRVDKHRSRDQGGSGLGLAIVKHIVEAHNQTIHVRSTPTVGTTFGFTLEKV